MENDRSTRFVIQPGEVKIIRPGDRKKEEAKQQTAEDTGVKKKACMFNDLKGEAFTFSDAIAKFNPFHDRLGRFTTGGMATSFTYAPGKSRAHDLAIARMKERANQFSEERKTAAITTFNQRSPEEADKLHRANLGSKWDDLSDGEKDSIYWYTQGSGKINRPLRGYEGSWKESDFKGAGKVDLDAEGGGQYIKDLTSAINKSPLPEDMVFRRGINERGLAGFLGMDEKTLKKMKPDQLKQFEYSMKVDEGFMSVGAAQGKGFTSAVTVNVYCPKGTKAIYAEPVSHYNPHNKTKNANGAKTWDGKSEATNIGKEQEVIIQRGSTYTITGIRKVKSGSKYKYEMDIEVSWQIKGE